MLNEEIQEQPTSELGQNENPDETAAVLSFATKLSEGLLPKAPQTQETRGTSVPKQKNDIQTKEEPEVDLEANNKEMEKMMNSKLDELRKEVKETIKEELSEIKDTIQEALQEDVKE